MTIQDEEQILLKKIIHMKRENELLMVIFEEAEELIKNGYFCSHCADETKGIFYAVREYNNWRDSYEKDKKRT